MPRARFLHDLLTLVDPERPALVAGGIRRSFGELALRVDRLAGALCTLAQPGARVAIVGPNVPAWVECYYAAPRVGMRLAFVNHRLSRSQMLDAVRSVRPTVLIAGTEELALLEATGSPDGIGVPSVMPLGGDLYEALIDAGHPTPPVECEPTDTAWLIATSGTSGLPKQVALSHRNLLVAGEVTSAMRPTEPGDVYLFPFPLCHVAGYNVLQTHANGLPVVLMERFDAEQFVALTHTHSVTTTSLAPTMIHALVDLLEATGERLPELRAVSYGSGPIAPSLLRRAMALLDVDFQQGYGMTELAGNAAFLSGADHRRALSAAPRLLHAAGRVGPGVELRIVDDEGNEVSAGGAGEIAVRGALVMQGYWEAPAANAEAFIDGWFRTGDVGRVDADGYLYVIDRKKDIIITGGENVSSREVEDLLVGHPAIREAAVVGVADERWGEAVCAVVVASPGSVVDPDDVLRYGRDAIGGFKKPRHAVVVDSLPRNASGKVLKRELRSLAAAKLAEVHSPSEASPPS